MTPDAVLAALELPAQALVDQRIAKRHLLEQGRPTATDRREISESIEELRWIAALKPTTGGPAAFRDERREYLEVAVLCLALRGKPRAVRLVEFVHRAIPYPVVLISTAGSRVVISLAHKRWSEGEKGQTVLDGDVIGSEFRSDAIDATFLAALSLSQQPRNSIWSLYQGWMDTVFTLQAARITGVFRKAGSPEQAAARREALGEFTNLETAIARLRAAAAKERQLARQVDVNLELQRLEQQRALIRQSL